MEEISYIEFLWNHILGKKERELIIKDAILNELDKQDFIDSDFNEDIEILLLYDQEINQSLKRYMKEHEVEINIIQDSLDSNVSSFSKFRFEKISDSNKDSSQKSSESKHIFAILQEKKDKTIKNDITELKFLQFDKELSDGAILTVKGFFTDEFNEEFIELLGNPKIWFQWDNIDSMTRIYNSLEELRDDFDGNLYENYFNSDDYYQMGVLLDKSCVPEDLRNSLERFYRLPSGSIDKSISLETNEIIDDVYLGLILLEGVPAQIESFLDSIVIIKDTD